VHVGIFLHRCRHKALHPVRDQEPNSNYVVHKAELEDTAFGPYRWTAFYLDGGGERERKEREKKGGGKERKRRGKVQTQHCN
jgi:hypothetical protein